MDLTDAQYEILLPLLPEEELVTGKRGRPWRDPRDILNGVLWVMRTGAPWKDLPGRYPPYQTCHRRFQQWVEDGVFERILSALAEDLRERGKVDLTEAFIDGSRAGAKKRAPLVGKTRRGRATKIMAMADGNGLPLSIGIASGQRHEIKLVEDTLDACFLNELSPRLIGDKAYDSNALDERLLEERNVELIAPHHPTRINHTQDGRPLRRYKRRWKVERVFAWLFNFRRLVTRWERKAENFLGFLQLGCTVILLRRL
ncbi:MAG: IS5 family transposase [Cyanobacteria bacterium J06648_11]